MGILSEMAKCVVLSDNHRISARRQYTHICEYRNLSTPCSSSLQGGSLRFNQLAIAAEGLMNIPG